MENPDPDTQLTHALGPQLGLTTHPLPFKASPVLWNAFGYCQSRTELSFEEYIVHSSQIFPFHSFSDKEKNCQAFKGREATLLC